MRICRVAMRYFVFYGALWQLRLEMALSGPGQAMSLHSGLSVPTVGHLFFGLIEGDRDEAAGEMLLFPCLMR